MKVKLGISLRITIGLAIWGYRRLLNLRDIILTIYK
jgi:hypothetical protein